MLPLAVDLQSLKINRAPAPRRTGNRWPGRLALLLLAGVAAWLFGPSLLEFADRMRLPVVQVHQVTATAGAAAAAVRGTAANGHVVAARRAALSSDVPGRIVELRVTEGTVVRKGDIVARLFSDEFRAAVDRAKADLAVGEAAALRAGAALAAATAEERQQQENVQNALALFNEGEALFEWWQKEYDRVDDLLRQGIASPLELDKARSDQQAAHARLTALAAAHRAAVAAQGTARTRIEVAEADRKVAEAQQQAAQAALTQAQATLDKMDVRAPFDGVVVLKDAEVGEVVSPNSQGGSNARGAVCTMVDLDSLEVQANVPESSLQSVVLGAPADIFLDARPDHRYEGRVDRIWPTADRQKATVEVRIKFVQRDDQVRPENGVRVVFRGDTGAAPDTAAVRGGEILVPEGCIVQIDGQDGVFRLERDVATFQPVTTGTRRLGRVLIEQGLQTGQRILENPPATLRSGDRVRVENP